MMTLEIYALHPVTERAEDEIRDGIKQIRLLNCVRMETAVEGMRRFCPEWI